MLPSSTLHIAYARPSEDLNRLPGIRAPKGHALQLLPPRWGQSASHVPVSNAQCGALKGIIGWMQELDQPAVRLAPCAGAQGLESAGPVLSAAWCAVRRATCGLGAERCMQCDVSVCGFLHKSMAQAVPLLLIPVIPDLQPGRGLAAQKGIGQETLV